MPLSWPVFKLEAVKSEPTKSVLSGQDSSYL